MTLRRLGRAVALSGLVTLMACGGSDDDVGDGPPPSTATPIDSDATPIDSEAVGDVAELFPDVIAASATMGDGTWTIAATLSSPYDSPERYADAWRVLGPDGAVYGERLLTHDHAGEQPFTRSQSGIEIPDDVDEVIIEGRDQISGWGGQTFTLMLPR